MKAFLASLCALAVIVAGSAVILNSLHMSSAEVYSTQSVRLD